MIKSGLFTVFLTLVFIGNILAQDAKAILSKMDDVIFAAEDKQGEMRITLRAKSGKGKVREALLFQKGANRRLTIYTKPETQAGISTLALPDGVMWLYMPALGGPKKISILSKSQAFNTLIFYLFYKLSHDGFIFQVTAWIRYRNDLNGKTCSLCL